HGVAVDALGKIHVAGYFQGEADLGGEGGPESGSASYTAFVGSYATNLDLVHVATFDGDGRVIPASIAVDANGTIAVSGHFSGTTGIGTSAGTSDAFVAVFENDGTLRWTKQFG